MLKMLNHLLQISVFWYSRSFLQFAHTAIVEQGRDRRQPDRPVAGADAEEQMGAARLRIPRLPRHDGVDQATTRIQVRVRPGQAIRTARYGRIICGIHGNNVHSNNLLYPW